jgi:bifunctional DNase/RNase
MITELAAEQVIFLKEKDGERTFPIMIGIHEAKAIDDRVKGQQTPRPMTHELLANVIHAVGASVEKILINDIRDHTFIATLFLRRGEELIEVDSRPSDAIALGVAFDTPIFVAEHVLDTVLSEPTREDRIEMLRQRLAVLGERITEFSQRLGDESFLAKAPREIIDGARRQLEEMKTQYEAIERVLRKLG